MPTQPASQPTPDPGVMLFDFRQAGRVDYWAVVNDGVMGGVSDSRISWLEDTAMLFAGTVRLENNGGFASVQASFAPFDASDFDGVALDVRGDGLRYGFYLRDARFGAVRFQTNFETEAGSWQTVRLPFTSFEPLRLGTPVEAAPLDLSQLSGAAFIISDKQAGPFALEVGAIRLTAGP